MAVRLEGEPQLPKDDSEEAFITELYGIGLSKFLVGHPSSAFVAAGSEVLVREGRSVS